MALVRWFENDLFNQFNKLQRELERSWTGNWPGYASPGSAVYPPMNIYDDSESFIVRAELPGVNPKDLDISVTGNTLTVRGKREVEPVEEGCCYHRRERSSGEFRRAFTLPEQVNSSKVMASMTNGILEIRLPRAEQAKQRKIEVKSM
jgi:HSP20 family protein